MLDPFLKFLSNQGPYVYFLLSGAWNILEMSILNISLKVTIAKNIKFSINTQNKGQLVFYEVLLVRVW